jgi:hypothetical protein
MRLANVALHDFHTRLAQLEQVESLAPLAQRTYNTGGYDPSGWSFGVFHPRREGAWRSDRLAGHGLPVLSTRPAVAQWFGVATTNAP